jgi:acetylornithine deacetylase/succinyl-diaminopimelate desuccinylase-like protein
MRRLLPLALAAILAPYLPAQADLAAQAQRQPDWSALEDETMRHFQALVRFDTSDPPGNEKPAADYLQQVLEAEGIPVQVFALEPHRPNVVARLKGNGSRRPLLLMAHTDVVNVDPSKWRHPPFGAVREGGYVYGRGTVDDKDNVTAVLMAMLTLKRLNVPLDRDVIALFESGEEGTTRVGIQYMVNEHFAAIDAEYCLAEGGGVRRRNGQVRFAAVQTLEKIPRAITLTARGVAGHGSVPLQSNAVVRLSEAVAKVGRWVPPVQPNETTDVYFKRLATISTPEDAQRYRAAVDPDPAIHGPADEYFRANEPAHASMLRTSVSPNIFQAGYRLNVIPSDAVATLDVRMLPQEDPQAFLDEVRKVIEDPLVDAAFAPRDVRPAGETRLDTEAFTVLEQKLSDHYGAITLPTMSTGATDMAYLRARGIQCYGIGPAVDVEDGPKGYGAHSDQERILESELHRFVRFHYDTVTALAGSRAPQEP